MMFFHMLFAFCAVSIPNQLIKPGVIIVGGKTCKYTKKIVDWMTYAKRPFTVAYIDENDELKKYIVKAHKGGIPIVFENGIYKGTGKQYMQKLQGITNQRPNPAAVSPPIRSSGLLGFRNRNIFLKNRK